MTARRAHIEVSYELLILALRLPAGAKLLRADDMGGDFHGGPRNTIRLLVEHPDLPETHEGCAYPQVAPVMTRYKNGRVKMASWGL